MCNCLNCGNKCLNKFCSLSCATIYHNKRRNYSFMKGKNNYNYKKVPEIIGNVLLHMYITKKMSVLQMSEILGVNRSSIDRLFNKVGIQKRNRAEANKLSSKTKRNIPYWKGKHHTKLYKNNMSVIIKKSEKHKNGLLFRQYNSEDTDIEKVIENQLLFKGILYVKQYPYKLGIADFWLPESNTIIECDGDYWHNPKYFPKTVKRDKKQIEWLEKNNYIVFRFTGLEIKTGINNCINQIQKNI